MPVCFYFIFAYFWNYNKVDFLSCYNMQKQRYCVAKMMTVIRDKNGNIKRNKRKTTKCFEQFYKEFYISGDREINNSLNIHTVYKKWVCHGIHSRSENFSVKWQVN